MLFLDIKYKRKKLNGAGHCVRYTQNISKLDMASGIVSGTPKIFQSLIWHRAYGKGPFR